VVDGEGGVLPKTPAELRAEKQFMDVKIIAGINRDEGAYHAGVPFSQNLIKFNSLKVLNLIF
jgi:hypothetical protein